MICFRFGCIAAAALALAACSTSMTEEDAENLEEQIRTTYEERGAEVIEVDIDVVDDSNLGGIVRLRDPQTGMEAVNDCSATLEEGETQYEWTCVPST